MSGSSDGSGVTPPSGAEFPPALRAVIAKAVAKDAAERYASMEALASALEEEL